VSEFTPSYPEAEKIRPVIVHAPSHKGKKGTEVIESAIHQLRSSHEFDFRLIHNVEHSEAMKIVHDCDIMIDELVSGTYGLATLEAMAFGKPTICYQKPSVVANHPSDCPIVNANQDDVTQVLADLLQDGPGRRRIGHESRKYVEKYHDAHHIARDLVGIYQDLLAKVQRQK
jgi:glycosyltransferase involved in cell wall biosynthesis